MTGGRLALALAAVAAGCALGPVAAAPASVSMDVGIADDRLMFNQPSRAPALARRWAAMGIDVVRLHVRWVAVAPAPAARRPPPGFDAGDHFDRRYRWGYVDRAVQAVVQAGLEPMLTITGSGPLWATRSPAGGNVRSYPDPRQFGLFAQAVAARFGAVTTRYIVWNEPNLPAWLQPQSACVGRRCTPVAPHVYRRLLREAQRRIKATDTSSEVLAGALAPSGRDAVARNRPLRPLAFLRAMGCVDRRYRPVRTGACRGFRPPVFDALAHHPHGILRGPHEASPHPDDAALADLRRLERALDRIQDAGGFRISGGGRAPLHLTEFGYQTDPPDPFVGVTLGRQARWLQHSAFLAWRDPRVRSLVQYEYEDEPVARKTATGRSAFSGWQSGLRTSQGRPKPALAAFVNPIWAQRTSGGSRQIVLWGQARPGTRHTVTLERRADGLRPWRRAARLRTDARGVWRVRRIVGVAAEYRFTYAGGASRPLRVPASPPG